MERFRVASCATGSEGLVGEEMASEQRGSEKKESGEGIADT